MRMRGFIQYMFFGMLLFVGVGPALGDAADVTFENTYIEIMATNQSIRDMTADADRFMYDHCGKKVENADRKVYEAAEMIYGEYIKEYLEARVDAWGKQDAPFLQAVMRALYGRIEIYRAKIKRPRMSDRELTRRLEGNDKRLSSILRAARYQLDLPSDIDLQKKAEAVGRRVNATNMVTLCHD